MLLKESLKEEFEFKGVGMSVHDICTVMWMI